MKNWKKDKKAFFFTTDALIALALLIAVMAIVPSTYVTEKVDITSSNLLYQDVKNVLSNMRIHHLNTSYIKKLINETNISDTNISVMQAIGEFWVSNQFNIARNITSEMFLALDEKDHIALYVGNDLVYSKGIEDYADAENIAVSKEVLSGIEAGEAVKGYSAKAFIQKNKKSAITYFGGYIGDGNISVQINLGNLTSVESAYLELAANTGFSLKINGNSLGNFYKSSNSSLIPDKYNISIGYFINGTNTLEFRSVTSEFLYIAGGYLKVYYKTTDVSYYYDDKYKFPGIDGLINLYDSFYVPSQIQEISIYLHYNSNYTAYLNLGNVTVFEKNSTGQEQEEYISNSESSSLLDYSDISLKTIPLRFGLKEIQQVLGDAGNADIVLITDLSDSMDWRMDSEVTGIARECDDLLLYDDSTKRISIAKCLDKEFVRTIVNATGNRIGLSAFYGDAGSPYKGRTLSHDLSYDIPSLESHIETYFTQGGTCICCSINEAYEILSEQSNSSRDKYIVVMTDGIPTHHCEAMSGCTGDRIEGLWLGWGAGCYGGLEDCVGTDCICAMENTNYSACRANRDLNATVHAIGFGPIADCENANKTLKWISECGNGDYFASANASELAIIYSDIAKGIVNISFIKQTIYVEGNLTSVIYPDSYISFNYTPPTLPFGSPLTLESLNFSSEGIFNIPKNMSVAESSLISYSGDAWTKYVEIKNLTSAYDLIYNLTDYGEKYIALGDPYAVKIPISLISEGNNSVKLITGISAPNNSIVGPSNKVIYTIIIPFIRAYSDILPIASGCLWEIEFEDGTSIDLLVPSNYTNGEICNMSDYNENDAMDSAVFNLLQQLDFDNDKIIDTKFSVDEFGVEVNLMSGIPYMWFSSAEIRSWN